MIVNDKGEVIDIEKGIALTQEFCDAFDEWFDVKEDGASEQDNLSAVLAHFTARITDAFARLEKEGYRLPKEVDEHARLSCLGLTCVVRTIAEAPPGVIDAEAFGVLMKRNYREMMKDYFNFMTGRKVQ